MTELASLPTRPQVDKAKTFGLLLLARFFGKVDKAKTFGLLLLDRHS